MAYTYDPKYLKSKGVTYQECVIIIDTTNFHYPNGYSDSGNPRIMFVGKPGLRKPVIEVVVEFFDEDEEIGQEEIWHIYHVRKPAKTESKRKARYEE